MSNILCTMQGKQNTDTRVGFVHEPTQAYNSDAHFQESRLLMNHLLKGQSTKEQSMLGRWTSSVLKPDSFRTKSLPLRQTKFKTSYTPFTLTKLV